MLIKLLILTPSTLTTLKVNKPPLFSPLFLNTLINLMVNNLKFILLNKLPLKINSFMVNMLNTFPLKVNNLMVILLSKLPLKINRFMVNKLIKFPLKVNSLKVNMVIKLPLFKPLNLNKPITCTVNKLNINTLNMLFLTMLNNSNMSTSLINRFPQPPVPTASTTPKAGWPRATLPTHLLTPLACPTPRTLRFVLLLPVKIQSLLPPSSSPASRVRQQMGLATCTVGRPPLLHHNRRLPKLWPPWLPSRLQSRTTRRSSGRHAE